MSRLEDAVTFCRQAANIYVKLQDLATEGRVRSNLANTLIKLQRYDEARRELQRAIECKQPYGHAAEPWTTWNILRNLEQATGPHRLRPRRASRRSRATWHTGATAARIRILARTYAPWSHNPSSKAV
jgi:tetratricopeptide (TPR) repeat protein